LKSALACDKWVPSGADTGFHRTGAAGAVSVPALEDVNQGDAGKGYSGSQPVDVLNIGRKG